MEIRFTKEEMLTELREVVYQYARASSFVLDIRAGYRLLDCKAPKNDFEVSEGFMNPEIDSTTSNLKFSIDDAFITKTYEQFYDYGLLGIRNLDLGYVIGSTEWSFAYAFVRDAVGSSLIAETLNGEYITAERCIHAARAFVARCVLDGGERFYFDREPAPAGMLTIAEVAILAGLDDRTVRNATSKNAVNRLGTALVESSIYIPRESAIDWLRSKRGFRPTRVGDEFPAAEVLASEFVSSKEAGDFIRVNRERLGFDHKTLIERAGCKMAAKDLKDLEVGKLCDDEESLTAIGKTMGFDGTLFALRIIEAKQKDRLSDLQSRISVAARV